MPTITGLPTATTLTPATDKTVAVVSGVTSDITTDNLVGHTLINQDGVVWTVNSRSVTGIAALGGANRTNYTRMTGGKVTASTFVIYVGTSSGNISVAIYPNNGSNGTAARPSGSRRASTGAISCPTGSSFATVTFTGSTAITPGDWMGLSADGTTATFARATALAGIGAGVAYHETSAHPAPATVGSLVATGSAYFGSSE